MVRGRDTSVGLGFVSAMELLLEQRYCASKEIIDENTPLTKIDSNLHLGGLTFGSCFNERCLKPGLTCSPYRKGIPLGQALLSAELAVVLFFNNTTTAPG
jgi:hypothetical protein